MYILKLQQLVGNLLKLKSSNFAASTEDIFYATKKMVTLVFHPVIYSRLYSV